MNISIIKVVWQLMPFFLGLEAPCYNGCFPTVLLGAGKSGWAWCPSTEWHFSMRKGNVLSLSAVRILYFAWGYPRREEGKKAGGVGWSSYWCCADVQKDVKYRLHSLPLWLQKARKGGKIVHWIVQEIPWACNFLFSFHEFVLIC